ncbi:MAG: hypothetical protein ACOZF0_21355 [Thermodesulfobacteriota bacterium]
MEAMVESALRARFDRRTIDDRRRPQTLEPYVIVESRRKQRERRHLNERRSGWARITRFCSLNLCGRHL